MTSIMGEEARALYKSSSLHTPKYELNPKIICIFEYIIIVSVDISIKEVLITFKKREKEKKKEVLNETTLIPTPKFW